HRPRRRPRRRRARDAADDRASGLTAPHPNPLPAARGEGTLSDLPLPLAGEGRGGRGEGPRLAVADAWPGDVVGLEAGAEGAAGHAEELRGARLVAAAQRQALDDALVILAALLVEDGDRE